MEGSLFDATKATSIFQASIQPGRGDDDETVLVVAVRANGGLMDWVVNGNFKLVDVEQGIIVRISIPCSFPGTVDYRSSE